MTLPFALPAAADPTAEQAPATPPLMERRTCQRWPGAKYYLATPSGPADGAPVLVSVHGISRNARQHAATFARQCNRLGWYVVAPLFGTKRFPKYQQLGYSKRRRGPRPDLALNAILDEVGRTTGAATDQVFLFGYSGGGQFAHRYAMIHPGRVRAAVLGAPGWYTFPDMGVAYPRGLAAVGDALAAEPDIERFLRLPVRVLVGGDDAERDEALNTSPRIDHQQGRNRQERGRRWIETLDRAASEAGIRGWHEYLELDGCHHSFTQCMLNGRMDLLTLEFFLRTRLGSRPRADLDGRAGREVSPVAFVR